MAAEQEAAYKALRKGIMDYERRQIYRGPEKFVDLPADPKELDEAIDDALAEHPDNGDVMSAVVLEGQRQEDRARCAPNGEHAARSPARACAPRSRACPTRRRPRSRSAAAP